MMSNNDHGIKIGSEIRGLSLIRDDNGTALYSVTEDIPNYQPQLRFRQNEWIGGHGQYDFSQGDMYFEGQSIDTTQEGRILLGPLINQVGVSGDDLGANPVGFIWFEAIEKWIVVTATKVFWYDGTNFVQKSNGEFDGKVINGREMAEFNGVLFIPLAGTDEYYYTADCVTFTESTLTADVMHGFFQAPNPAGTANVLYGLKLPNELYTNTVGTNAGTPVQWDSGTNVGDTSNNIIKGFLIGNNLMIGKEDNLFHYDSDGGVHPLMNDLRHNRSATNFKYATEWQTGTYFSRLRGIGEITSYNSFDTTGPLKGAMDINKIGICVGLASDADWMFPVMDEGTNSIIYKGREVRQAGALRWEWCPWVFLGTNACATAKVCQHSATDRRLWFGYGDYAGYVILTDNPTATSSGATFASSGWIRMSYVYGTDKYWDKLFQSIVTETKSCTSGKTVTPKYRKDTDTTATVLAPAITTNGIVNTNLGNEIDCKRIQFELHLATNASTATPEVLYFEARGTEKPETVRVHEATYAVGDTPSKRAKTIRDFLRSARTSEKLIKFADLRYGQSIDKDYTWVVMQPGYPREVEVAHEKGRQPELGLQCRWQEVSYG